MGEKKIRVIMAIPGFDGHWRGSAVVTRALRDAGMEVIYMGQQQPEGIAKAAIEEDVDVVGLSIYAAGHVRLIKKVIDAIEEKGGKDILVVVGGVIPQPDIPKLKEIGVAEVFPPGSPLDKIVNFITENVS
ncbi:MAG: cobalamin B12-binding domain-containing protein [Candidatus Syntropharchaeia archaeon]